jgi:hypothetical protein
VPTPTSYSAASAGHGLALVTVGNPALLAIIKGSRGAMRKISLLPEILQEMSATRIDVLIMVA